MKRFLIALVVVLAVVAPAFAIPEWDQIALFYDEYGNVIGEHDTTCGYPYHSSWGDTTGDIITIEVISSCSTFEPLTCGDVGMSSIGSCGDNGWCVSNGYAMSYDIDYVPDCHGICKWGEGPGASGDWYRSTCAQTGVVCDPVKLGRPCP